MSIDAPSPGPLAGRHVVIVPAWWPSPEDRLAGVFFQDYVRMFAAAGARVGVVYPDLVSPRKVTRDATVSLIPRTTIEQLGESPVLRMRGLHTAFGRPWLQMQRFRRWLRKGLAAYSARFGRPDVLHAMCAIPSGWACTHLSDALARRVIITEHTGPFSLALTPATTEPFVFEAIRRAVHVVAVSEVLKSQMIAAGATREIRVIGNPVADDFTTSPILPAQQMSPGKGPLHALFVGRLTPEKGVYDLIDAAQRLAPRCDVIWHLIGDGPLAPELEQTVKRPELANRVKLHGPLDRPQIRDHLRSADFFVHPSHGETFGLAFAEALCMGLPYVATDAAAQALSPRPEDGVLFKAGSPADLAAAVETLISTKPSSGRTNRAAHYRARFSAQAVALQYAELIASPSISDLH